METQAVRGRHSTATSRSSGGCWTCRLRRKKCDEKHPVCETCANLQITCHYESEKPEWMVGGVQQDQMARRLKREVREKAHHRRRSRAAASQNGRTGFCGNPAWLTSAISYPPQNQNDLLGSSDKSIWPYPGLLPVSTLRSQHYTDGIQASRDVFGFGQADTILLTFYLEHVFPFLFPFYHPRLRQGGKAWVLELMISSPVVRQAILCQSSFFLSSTKVNVVQQPFSNSVYAETSETFKLLRQAIQTMDDGDITQHLHSAARLLASIMQVQRLETTVRNYENCQRSHLNAALSLFEQMLASANLGLSTCNRICFDAIVDRLGPPSRILPAQSIQVPSVEQTAFRFSTTMLILDDVIASTVRQEQPQLYNYHRELLEKIDDRDPAIDLKGLVGCENWIFLAIGEISSLDAWKQRCKTAGNLNVVELVERATAIRTTLIENLTRLEHNSTANPNEGSSLLDFLSDNSDQQSPRNTDQTYFATQIWVHAGLIYLFVVVSGWQPASDDVQYHVGQLFELASYNIEPPALLRTMAWPLCVAGCLAQAEQEAQFRKLVTTLQPSTIFTTAYKALEIMEMVWRKKATESTANWDLATCFKILGKRVLLV